jgi:hypothetical protein
LVGWWICGLRVRVRVGGLLGWWVVDLVECRFGWLLGLFGISFLELLCCFVVLLIVAGLLGCWVAGLLGCWGCWGCWVDWV